MKLTKEDIYKGYLVLVNKDNEIKSDFSDFKKFPNYDICLEKETFDKLMEVLEKLNTSKIVPVSGYRSHLEQINLYNDSLKTNGLDFTKKYVAKPGSSEHELGLAIDLGVYSGVELDYIRPSFPHSGIANSFRILAKDYGFIERYKKEKEQITNISAEEWHFRYVTYPHSKIIVENNFALEEYIEYLKQFKEGSKSLNYENYEISYLKYEKDIEINLNDKDMLSGDNQEGFIITRVK